MHNSTCRCISQTGGVRGVVLVRRVLLCIALVASFQCLFVVTFVCRPTSINAPVVEVESSGDDVTSSVEDENRKLMPIQRHQSLVDAAPTWSQLAGGRQQPRWLHWLSGIRRKVADYVSLHIGHSWPTTLPRCTAPSRQPAELNWWIDESLTSQEPDFTFFPLPTRLPEDREGDNVQRGGHWQPQNCTAQHHIAIVVPYRARQSQLQLFLDYMHPFLQRQQLEYTIYVVEQTNTSRFNRALLFNIAFIESGKLTGRRHDCYFFHDVDLLPENDLNLYTCPEQPRHQAAAVNTWFYRLPYKTIFGGVEAFKTEHFKLINGFSNLYFGWGGEDDDLYQRVELLKTGLQRMDVDGLNSLCYSVKTIQLLPRYTRIFADFNETYQTKAYGTNYCDNKG